MVVSCIGILGFGAPAAMAQSSGVSITRTNGAEQTFFYRSNPDSVQQWIVRFAPDTPAKTIGVSEFSMDLERAIASQYGAGKLSPSPVRPLDIINGASFSAPPRVLPVLLKLPYVLSFDANRAVQIEPLIPSTTSEGIVGIQGSQSTGLTGKGVIIAIIDTGVDYTHPDLGGCIGARCRVIGGFDVVDGDDDPFDEHGHGTHVAGTAAGRGLSNGLAQDASILAYRALDENGTGTIADVIDAIGRAVDDGAHIINLSLGDADGQPRSPQNLAVREAVRRGVLVVAAAGNSGPRWGTVGSPGSEETALTVGALNGLDEPAAFSSRGPVRVSYALKPDISAPGVGILSAIPGGGHIRLNGTSMATPYVAGVAALLKEYTPDADALLLRSRMIQSATSLPFPVWQVGLGKVSLDIDNYLDAASYPASIGLLVRESESAPGNQVESIDLTLWNFRGEPRSWTISYDLPPGVSAAVQSSATVPGEGSASVEVSLIVDPSLLPYPATTPPLHLGFIRFVSAPDTLTIPIGISRPSEAVLEFQMPPSLVVVHDRNGAYEAMSTSDRFVNISVGAGVFDIWAIRDADATKWVREGVSIKGSTPVRMYDTDAPNTLRFEITDTAGNSVGACGYSREFLRHNPSGLGLIYQYERSCPEASNLVIQTQISDLSHQMRYEVSHVANGAATGYAHLRYPFRLEGGMHGNQLLRSGGDQFRQVRWKYHMPSGVSKASLIRRFDSPGGSPFTPPNWLKSDIVAPWIRAEHLIPNPSGDFVPFQGQYDAVFALDGDQFDPDDDAIFMLTPSIYLVGKDSLRLRTAEIRGARTWTESLRDMPLTVGTGPDSWNPGGMTLANGELRIPTSNSWFAGWYRDMRAGKVDLELFGPSGELLDQRIVWNGTPNYGSIHPDDWIVHQLVDGSHQLTLTRTDTWLGTRQQTTEATIQLDRNADTSYLSCIERLAILDASNQPVQSSEVSTGLKVVVEGIGCPSVPSVSLRHWSSQQSISLQAVSYLDAGIGRYVYEIPNSLDAGHFDLSIQINHGEHQFMSYASSPALAITNGIPLANPPIAPLLSSPTQRQFVFDSQVQLRWNEVDTADGYRLQLSNDPDFSDMRLDSLTSSASLMANVHGYGLNWYWRVSARNDEGWGPWSVRRYFTTVIESTDLTDDQLPVDWFLGQNYPNPFNPSTTIRFGIAATEAVRIDVYTIAGQLVRSVDVGTVNPGTHVVQLDLGSMSSGLYLYRITTPSFTQTRKMTLIK